MSKSLTLAAAALAIGTVAFAYNMNRIAEDTYRYFMPHYRQVICDVRTNGFDSITENCHYFGE